MIPYTILIYVIIALIALTTLSTFMMAISEDYSICKSKIRNNMILIFLDIIVMIYWVSKI